MLPIAWVILYLGIALPLLPAYGLVWDCPEFAFGELMLDYLETGEPTFLTESTSPAAHRHPHPEFVLQTKWYQEFPLGLTMSALSCRVLWSGWGLLAAVQAHHLFIVLMVALLVGVLVRFTIRHFGVWCGLAAPLLLLLSPRFFAHSFNNVKDMPETCFYGCALVAGYAALTSARRSWWVLTGIGVALALAQKPNALFLPVHLVAYLLVTALLARNGRCPAPRGVARGGAIATGAFALTYFAVSPQLWSDTGSRLLAHFGYILRVGNSLVDAPSGIRLDSVDWSGALMVLVTTPVPFLVLAVIGIAARAADIRIRVFLLLWLAIPIARTMLPGMRNFDGVRHFLEYQPALAILAALGLRTAIGWVGTVGARMNLGATSMRWLRCAVPLAALVSPAIDTIRTHPNGVCYFNVTVGGLGGAQELGIPEATDYWANSYWQGLRWLSERAEPGASLVVPVAPQVAACAAPVRLRPDIRLLPATDPAVGRPLYVMYVTRPQWYGPFTKLVDASRDCLVHEIVVQGGAILRIHRFDAAPRYEEVTGWRQREFRAFGAAQRVRAWAVGNGALGPLGDILAGLRERGLDESVRRVRAILPADLRQDGADAIWLLYHGIPGGVGRRNDD